MCYSTDSYQYNRAVRLIADENFGHGKIAYFDITEAEHFLANPEFLWGLPGTDLYESCDQIWNRANPSRPVCMHDVVAAVERMADHHGNCLA